MANNWFAQNPLKLFTEQSVETVHDSALSLLDKVGVGIDSEEALTLLAQYGVRRDPDRKRVYPDEAAIQRALTTVSRRYTVYGRQPSQPQTLDIGLDTIHTISGGAALVLHSGGDYRDATRDDLVDMIVLHEKLDSIDILINPVEPPEMKGPNIYPEIAALLFCHSSKPLLLQASGKKDLTKIIRMAELLAGGHEQLKRQPLFMTGSNAEPPLFIPREAAEVLILAARSSIPVSLGAYVMAGSTGPLDVAASIAQRTATLLCGLVLTQAASPGSAYDFACHAGGCNLATGDVVTMSPETMQLVAGSVQMGRHYQLVTQALAATEAQAPDAQAAGERALGLAVAAMCGASLIHGTTAEMSGMLLADFAQCTIDNEIARYVLDFAAGISMDGLDEALGAIRDVVTDPQYASLGLLGHPHTAKYCRDGRYEPDLFRIGMFSRRRDEQQDSLYGRAQERVAELLAERQEFVPADLRQELFDIVVQD